MSKEDGKYIGIRFSEEITSNLSAILGYTFKEGAQDCAAYVSSQYSSYGAANLIDGNAATVWIQYPVSVGTYALFTLSSARICAAIRMYLYTSFYPSSFEVYGSNDNSEFTKLGDTISSGTISTTGYYTYTFANSIAYTYYKVVMVSHNSVQTKIGEILLSYPASNELAFTVSGKVYNWVPNGSLVDEEFTVVAVTAHPTEENSLLLEISDTDRFESVIGDLSVSYDAVAGNLAGYGGPVDSFSLSFTPSDLIWKGDQNDQENLELISIVPYPNLIHVIYSDSKADSENLELTNVSATGTLTNINDL